MIYNQLIIAYLFLFTYLASKNIKWGLYFICLTLPAYLIRFSIFGLPATLLESMIIILFITWLIKEKISLNAFTWYKNLKQNPSSYNAVPQLLRWPIILLLVASTISVFVSPNQQAAAGIWKAYFIEPIMFFLIFIYTIKTSEDLKKIIRCLGITVMIIGLMAIYQKLTGNLIPNPFWANEATRRITAFFSYPNAVALFVLPIMILTISNIINPIQFELKKYHRLMRIGCKAINYIIIILGFLAILWTKSAGAMIGLSAGLLTWMLIYKKTRLPALLICFSLAILCLTPAMQNKLSNTLYLASQTKLPLVPTDLQMRTQIWREALSMLSARPILGAGLAGYQTLIAPYHINKHIEIYLYPHNFFLNFWSETGLFGLAAIIWLLVVFFFIASKQRGTLTYGAISAIIALLLQGFVDVPYFKNDLAVLFWIIIGIVIIIHNVRWGGRVVEGATLEK